jgi:hypothetical protein
MKNQRWRELCALAAVEQDPRKLMELVAEIVGLFDEQQAKNRPEFGRAGGDTESSGKR